MSARDPEDLIALLAGALPVGGAPGELERHAFERDGARCEVRFEPQSAEALAAGLACIQTERIATLVRGNGSGDALGNPLRELELLLSTRGLSGIDELDEQDGVVRVRAGTELAELQQRVGAAGWEVPLDPPGSASVGGTLAAAAIGPRRLGHGAPRDCVLGLDVVLASGERTRCGGRVVKNVTGYDLAKLYTGACGSLGVIESAWLRLRPRPEASRSWLLPLSTRGSAPLLALDAARRATARCAALLTPGSVEGLAVGEEAAADWLLLVELAGARAAVEQDGEWLASKGAARSLEGTSAIDQLRGWQGEAADGDGLLVRFALLPSNLPLALPLLVGAGAQVVAHPGVGLVYASWRRQPDRPAALVDALRTVDACVELAHAQARFECLPLEHKRSRDVFADSSVPATLARALKQRFDPAGVLNPGRFAGRL